MFKGHYPGGTAALKSAYFSVDEKAPTSTMTFVDVMNCYQLLHVTFAIISINCFQQQAVSGVSKCFLYLHHIYFIYLYN